MTGEPRRDRRARTAPAGGRSGPAGARSGGAQAPPPPAFLVKGDDPTLMAEALRGLVADLVGGEDANLVVEDVAVDEVGVAAVLDACLTPPFLTARRVVLARNAGVLGADDGARLAAYLDDPLPTTALVLVAGGGQVPQKLANAVKRVGRVVDATVPSGRGRAEWLAERLRDGPVRLDPAARELLGAHLGEDLGRVASLLEVLAAAYGDGARVGPDQIRPFLGEAGSVAPWDLTDAIDRGETGAALEHLHRMMAAGERHPLVVMATLHRHYTAMLRLDGAAAADEAEAARILGTRSTFPARKALTQARKLGPGGVRRAVKLLADADVDLRGARAWPDALVLEVLVARLSRLAPRAPSRAPSRRR